jgi:hypothetical protein
MRIRHVIFAAAAAASLAACAEEPKFTKARSEMTQRERDSTIAASGLPGSGVVRKAITISDAEAKRAAEYDSAAAQ